MPDYFTQNKELIKRLKGTIAYTDIRNGYLGKISAADTINPDPTEDLEQGFVWVRFHENGEAIKARCHKISARMPDMPVRVGRDATTREWTVLEVVPMDVGAINELASTFSVPDRNDDWIYERVDANRFRSLHVIPGTDAFDVEVEPGYYWHQGAFKGFTGGTINIASSVPTGGFGGSKRGVLIGIDASDDSLTSFDGEKIGLLETPGNGGKYFTETYVAETVNAADLDIYWIALIPITSEDSDWRDLYRVTALQLAGGNGASTTSGQVRVSSADTTPDYLFAKLSEGNGIDLTLLNPGANELVFIEVNESELSLGNLGDVTFTTPSANDVIYYDGAQWVNGKINVLKTGDSMSGTLTIITANNAALEVSNTVTLTADDANSYSMSNGANQINTGGFNATNTLGMVGYRTIMGAGGAGGTITGVSGYYALLLKAGTSTLTNAYGGYVDTFLKIAGVIDNIFGLYIASQNAATNNYAIYTNTGLNRLGDQLSIIGSANRIQSIVKANATQNVAIQEWQTSGGATLASIGKNGALTISQAATTGTPAASVTVTAAAHTALTASTEFTELDINLSATQQFATGALGTNRAVRFRAPTYSFVGASTLTTAVTVDIDREPQTGTNATITNAIALRVGGRTQINATVDITPPATTGSPRKGLLFTAPAHTALTASEFIDVNFDLSATKQFTTGSTIPTERAFWVQAPVYSATALTQTITDAVTFEISGAPSTSGSNIVLTNKYALRVASGISRFNGAVRIDGSVAGDNQFQVTGASSQSVDIFRVLTSGGTVTFRSGKNGNLFVAAEAGTGGPENVFNVTGAAHTSLTDGSEYTVIRFNIGQTYQWNKGGTALTATQRMVRIERPTLDATAATYTFTDAATFAIVNSPAATGNVTITSPWALWIQDGKSRFGKSLVIDGSTVSSPVAGEIWYDSTQKTFQYYNVVKQMAGGAVFAQTASATVANTVTETNLNSTGTGTLTLPANFFVAAKTIKVTVWGYYSTDSSAPTGRIRLKLGGTAFLDTAAQTMTASVANQGWKAEFYITCRTTGGSGTVFGQGALAINTGAAAGVRWDAEATATQTLDTTASQAITVQWTWGTAHANNTITCTHLFVEAIA